MEVQWTWLQVPNGKIPAGLASDGTVRRGSVASLWSNDPGLLAGGAVRPIRLAVGRSRAAPGRAEEED